MKKSIKILWSVFFIGLAFSILIILLANWGVFGKMPSIEDLQNPSASLASEVYADDGTLMGKNRFYNSDDIYAALILHSWKIAWAISQKN